MTRLGCFMATLFVALGGVLVYLGTVNNSPAAFFLVLAGVILFFVSVAIVALVVVYRMGRQKYTVLPTGHSTH
jgi:uncharacterized membrane protein